MTYGHTLEGILDRTLVCGHVNVLTPITGRGEAPALAAPGGATAPVLQFPRAAASPAPSAPGGAAVPARPAPGGGAPPAPAAAVCRSGHSPAAHAAHRAPARLRHAPHAAVSLEHNRGRSNSGPKHNTLNTEHCILCMYQPPNTKFNGLLIRYLHVIDQTYGVRNLSRTVLYFKLLGPWILYLPIQTGMLSWQNVGNRILLRLRFRHEQN